MHSERLPVPESSKTAKKSETIEHNYYKNVVNNHPPGSWDHETPDRDRIYFTSDFNSSCTNATVRSSQKGASSYNSLRREPLKRNKRLFTGWIVRLNNDNQLVVEGSLECGRRARTKPISERLSSSKILSKSKHLYYLVGNMVDLHYELPGYVRRRFNAGFPEDWDIVVEIWKSFIISPGSDARIKLSNISEDLIVEKKLKLAIGGCSDSDCFVECIRQANHIDGEKHSVYYDSLAQRKLAENGNEETSVTDHESQGNEKSRNRTTNNVKRISGWTPFVLSDENLKPCLIFKGILLSSMGHAVNRNHLTHAVHKRLSARIIETVNEEFYELIGDVNNAKRDIPKELVPWCRYGCPKDIISFCDNWRILKKEESHQFPITQFNDRDKMNKRKRIPIEINENYDPSDISVNYDTNCDEHRREILMNDSKLVKSFTKGRRKRRTNIAAETTKNKNTDIIVPQNENSKMIEQFHQTTTAEEDKQQGSTTPLKKRKVPLLSYVYHRCAPSSNDNILSDGV